jgi:hypothetical protein
MADPKPSATCQFIGFGLLGLLFGFGCFWINFGHFIILGVAALAFYYVGTWAGFSVLALYLTVAFFEIALDSPRKKKRKDELPIDSPRMPASGFDQWRSRGRASYDTEMAGPFGLYNRNHDLDAEIFGMGSETS